MKKFLTATAAAALMTAAGSVAAEDVKIGVLLGYTGPIESLAGNMAQGAELAMEEINSAGGILDGDMLVPVRADTGCIDNGLATSNAERLIAEGVKGIVGGDCSGVTGAILQNVARANGMVMISPSATSPALSTAEDDDLFFRTAPSDAREGEVMAEILKERGIESIALTYTNNDYGKGLADAIESSFKAAGGEVTIVAAHEDGRGDYSSEVAALAAAGGDILVVAGYLDQGGLGVIRSAMDAGAWDTFGMPGGMIGDSITEALGDDLNGSFGQIAGSGGEGTTLIADMSEKKGFDGTSAYAPESYDAAALFALAMQAAGSTEPSEYGPKIFEVANAPGEEIMPGELAKAIEILKSGGDIDYVGASAVELIGGGENAGSYREVEVKDGKYETVGYR
ncbi:ABC transporter substrate-binding protein [Chachezhania antarctica]|uniref:ABC transporter substrate-binding protein n=1 Tax=Chachezhania antarctica TaxID=2340860 RepID=UPI000EB3DAB1|nr:ABC transporter substrate-binding protein [Chachezhania antarctica]|tara:strand:- start:306 stop:1493 length:1188 start_codon:yes stop_codon:yes gene_type:complete